MRTHAELLPRHCEERSDEAIHGRRRRMDGLLRLRLAMTKEKRRLAMTGRRSEEHTELQSLMRNSYAVFCLKKKNRENNNKTMTNPNRQQPHTICINNVKV